MSRLRQLCWWPLTGRAARAYVAGPLLSDAVDVCRGLARAGLGSTIGFWNGRDAMPRQVADAQLAGLERLARETWDCHLSLKAPPLAYSRTLLGEIVDWAGRTRVRLHFDSLSPDTVEPTFALIDKYHGLSSLGCTLPGRWSRSLGDAERAVRLGLRVRVVKGQWADPDGPEPDARAGFLAVVNRLAGRARHVAVATHDAPLAREALHRLCSAGTSCELELLLGLPVREATEVARAIGVGIRCYVPYGQPSLPYRVADAGRNPWIAWWMARDLVLGGAAGRHWATTCARSMMPART
jgi:proline dehydrogenase